MKNPNRHDARRHDARNAVIRQSRRAAARPRERGYTLVALLALMTIMALAIAAAAPNIRRQKQRELELEAVARGEEVAEAIRRFMRAKGTLPKSMDELAEGVTPVGSLKKIQILRPAAAHDPLSSTGEWRLIKPNDMALIEFQRSVMLYAGNRPVPTNDPLLKPFEAQLTALVNTGTKESSSSGEDDSPTTTGPFIGVASRSHRDSMITYYGVERHDQWVFTPLFK